MASKHNNSRASSTVEVGRNMGEYSDGLYFEDETGVDRFSLRKSRRYLGLGIFGMICAIFCFFACVAMYNSGITSKQIACWRHELEVEELADAYVSVNGFTSFPAYVEDIPTFSTIEADCPSGGSYTWNPVTGEYYCSEHEHYPDGYFDESSTSLGSTTTTITTE